MTTHDSLQYGSTTAKAVSCTTVYFLCVHNTHIHSIEGTTLCMILYVMVVYKYVGIIDHGMTYLGTWYDFRHTVQSLLVLP